MTSRAEYTVFGVIAKKYEELLRIIDTLEYGEIVIKKEAGKIVVVKETRSIKLPNNGG